MRRKEQCVYLSWKACEKLAQEARISKLWINIGKDWYTADEFLKYINSLKTIGITEGDVKLKDPRPLIPRMEKYIQTLQQKKDEFEKRVNEYYRK